MSSFIPDEVFEHLEGDEVLQADTWSWWKWRNPGTADLREAFAKSIAFPEFRSLVRYRMRDAGKDFSGAKGWTFANDLYLITPKIGPGLRIQHGHSTIIFAESIGENFFVNQNVTIGVDKGKKPRIGNNVMIRAGAVVAGGVTIGDNVKIAPNAFVNFDVPAGKIVFPARAVIS